MIRAALCVAALLAAVAVAQPPIPSATPGVAVGSLSAPVRVDVYYDHLCSDSAANWPTWQQVRAHAVSAPIDPCDTLVLFGQFMR
jgi:hypothetical protein